MNLKDAFVVIEREREKIQLRINNLDYELSEARKYVIHLHGILAILNSSICQRCKGLGQYWVSYAQDDTKMKTCENCNGTGLPK